MYIFKYTYLYTAFRSIKVTNVKCINNVLERACLFFRTRVLGFTTVSFFIFLIFCTLKAATEENSAALRPRKASAVSRGKVFV